MKNYTTFVARFRGMKLADDVFGNTIEATPNASETSEEWKMRLSLSLRLCKIFQLTEEEKKLMLLNNPPKDVEKIIRLPFNPIFIDVEFTREEVKQFLGFDIPYPKIIGLLISERNLLTPYRYSSLVQGLKAEGITTEPCSACGKTGPHNKYVLPRPYFDRHICMDCADILGASEVFPEVEPIGRILSYDFFCTEDDTRDYRGIKNFKSTYYTFKTFTKEVWLNPGVIYNHPSPHVPYKIQKFLHAFTLNVLHFIHDPEVEVLEIPSNSQRDMKRMSRGKAPIPNRIIIKLKGQLRVYMDKIVHDKTFFTYSHRFYVRGHYRTYRNPRYKNAYGKTIFIEPFVKGQGRLIDRRYLLEGKE